MDKLCISILFLFLLYLVKILIDFKRFNNDPDCYNIYEKLQNAKLVYSSAIPLSYIYCLVGVYERCIYRLDCGDLLMGLLTCFGLVIVPILISMQNKGNNGVANSFSDMSGAIFFISAVTKPSIFLLVYTFAFIILLVLYIVKCERKDNYILRILVGIGADTILIIPSIFSDKVVTWLVVPGFLDNMLYYSITMFLAETIIPPLSKLISNKAYDKYKSEE